MTFPLLVVVLVAVTGIAVVASMVGGRRISGLRHASRLERLAVALSGLTLVATLVAAAIGGAGVNLECRVPVRDTVAAAIAVFAIPSILIAAGASVATLVVRSVRLGALALAAAVTAAGVDWFALAHSVHFC